MLTILDFATAVRARLRLFNDTSHYDSVPDRSLPRLPRDGLIVSSRTVLRRALFTKRHLQVDGVFTEISLAASADYALELIKTEKFAGRQSPPAG